MNNTSKSLLLFCVLLGITSAYYVADNDRLEGPAGYGEDDDVNDVMDAFKRTVFSIHPSRKLCIPWRSPCTHDAALISKYNFLKCCNEGACKCNLWGNNCRCEATLG
uniref:EGF-like domain-containing protein n=1 Tax=Arion vulgaris TaxID=1028688 RepID=A0A0B7BUF6_9EUPU